MLYEKTLVSIVLDRTYTVLKPVARNQENHVSRIFQSFFEEKDPSALNMTANQLFVGARLVPHTAVAFYSDSGYRTCPDRMLDDIYEYISAPAISVAMKGALCDALLDILLLFPAGDRAELLAELDGVQDDKSAYGISMLMTTVLWYAICEDYYLAAAAA